jgi:SAM-dependent methyltransferase
LGLKDATPYNILFTGPNPIFVDVLSFERRDPANPTWLPYGQFVRTFLLPLLVNQVFDVPLQQIFVSRRDGIEPEEVYRLCGLFRKLRPPFLTLVTIPSLLAAKSWKAESNIYQTGSSNSSEKARFILERVLTHLRKLLQKVEPKSRTASAWSNYMSSDNSYSEDAFKLKQAFVDETIRQFTPQTVLDVGCNQGHFSTIAAKNGSSVVAIDSDARVVGDVYNNALEKTLNILPLVVDLSRSTPALGWRNRECASFLDRAFGAFDAVLMLAVIHHMLVTDRIPLSEIIDLAADLTKDLLIIEFIAPADPMFQHLTRGRADLHKQLTRETFEFSSFKRFDILRAQQLGTGSRWLYLMRKKRNSANV